MIYFLLVFCVSIIAITILFVTAPEYEETSDGLFRSVDSKKSKQSSTPKIDVQYTRPTYKSSKAYIVGSSCKSNPKSSQGKYFKRTIFLSP